MLREFLSRLCRCGSNLFPCRSPFICASSTSITWERTARHVRRPAFSSHLVSSTIQVDVRLRKAIHAYPKVRPRAPYAPAFMGASRNKVVSSEGSNVILTKYKGHSENISWGLRFQRCGARQATNAKRYETAAKQPSHLRGVKNN